MKKISSVLIIMSIFLFASPVKAKDMTISYVEADLQQTRAQVRLFKDALDKFGALSPEEVASIWSEGEKTRNGVYHYAVSCKNLKDELIKKWGNPETNLWVMGTSSPWVEKCEIGPKKKLKENLYEITIKYYYSTSSGPFSVEKTKLTITKNGEYYCVISAKESPQA